MHPVLFKIPFIGLTIYTYGALVAAAFLAGIFYIAREAKRVGEDPATAVDLVFWLIVAAIFSSRIYYVLTAEPETIARDPLTLFKIWRGGLVFQGGVIGALIVGVFWVVRRKLSVWKYMDIFAPAIPLGHFIGRIGCFMSGCCHGREAPVGSWYSVTFPANANSFAPAGIPLYPTQLMEAFGELLIFLLLFFFRKHKRFDGQLMALYMLVYPFLRIFVEFYRGSDTKSFVFGSFSVAQLVSVLMFVFGAFIWFRRKRV